MVELDFLYPSEGIHKRWDCGYRITATAATWDQAAFVLSVPRRKPLDETQETLRTSAFPSTHVKVGNTTLLVVVYASWLLHLQLNKISDNIYHTLFYRRSGQRTSTLLPFATDAQFLDPVNVAAEKHDPPKYFKSRPQEILMTKVLIFCM